MNYQLHYNRLIEKAKNRINDGYTENHHIIPKSLGGLNDKENMIRLTAREHFIAHLLLAKIYGGKLWYAAWTLANTKGIKINSRIYELLKIKSAQLVSKRQKGNKCFLGKFHSEESKRKMSLAKKGIPKPKELRNRWSKTRTGKIFTEEHRKHMSEAKTGSNNPAYGTKMSEEAKAKRKETNRIKNNSIMVII